MGTSLYPILPDFPPITAEPFAVDLGGSLAVASKGLFSTGVSTDLSGEKSHFVPGRNGSELIGPVVTYLNSGGKIGDTLRAVRDLPTM